MFKTHACFRVTVFKDTEVLPRHRGVLAELIWGREFFAVGARTTGTRADGRMGRGTKLCVTASATDVVSVLGQVLKECSVGVIAIATDPDRTVTMGLDLIDLVSKSLKEAGGMSAWCILFFAFFIEIFLMF
jgi:hypothetical protein